jgi:hypothetical protein
MQELNISGCTGIDATAVATVVAKNRTLSALIFGDGMDEPASLEVGMTEADFSNKYLGVGGAIIISAWLTHKDTGAMTSLHVGMNAIPDKQMKEVIIIATSKDSMKLLCKVPIKDKALTELDVSGKSLGTEGTLVVAEYLRDNGALLSLNLASNCLRADGAKALATALEGNQAVTELNVASNELYRSDSAADMSGVIALANVIPGMGAMTSLNLAMNSLGAEGAKIVAEAIKVTMCTPAIIFAPFSCPSDFSINCCCLLLSAGHGGPMGAVFEKQRTLC